MLERGKNGYRLDPRHLRPTWANRLNNCGEPDWWFYEDSEGIQIYHQTSDGIQQAAIPKKWLLQYAAVSTGQSSPVVRI